MVSMNSVLQALEESISRAPSDRAALRATCSILSEAGRQGIELPQRLRSAQESCYARHLVHRQENGFCVVAMVWAPGQGAPVHDHGGYWCAEVCVEGLLQVVDYRRISDEPLLMVPGRTTCLKQGSVEGLLGPAECHRVHNPYARTAITLHVYGRELKQCRRYIYQGAGHYRPELINLRYTSTPEGEAVAA